MNYNSSRICLCRTDLERDAYLQDVLDIALGTLADSDAFCDATVILTGSLARGEGTVLKDESGFRSLSDMEFLVTRNVDHPIAKLVSELDNLEKEANKKVSASGKQCKIEFTYALERFFRTAKPSIFSFELKTHGKVLRGDSEPFLKMHGCTQEDIPVIDAFYLLCNRIIEQLDALNVFIGATGSGSEESFRYAILKFYVDIATSLLVFTRQYAPSYQMRQDRFMALEPSDFALIPSFHILRERVAYWTSVKLCPDQESLHYSGGRLPQEEWLELAEIVLSVWHWELAKIVGCEDNSLEEMQNKLKSFGTNSFKFRERIKYLLRAFDSRKSGGKVRFKYLVGNPRHALYIEASEIYRQVASKLKESRGYNASTLLTNSDIARIRNVLQIWSSCFRNA